MAAKVQLFGAGDLSITCTEDEPDVLKQGTFNSALVDKGQWIVYTKCDYNPDSWGPGECQVLTPDQGKQEIPFNVASIRRVEPFGSEGMTVYKHNDYCGEKKECRESLARFNVGGVSSMIISGGNWKIYTEPDFEGAGVIRGPGKYPNHDAMGFPNDVLQSIEKK